ncbi:MAG: PEP-CTERM sorting domain-containing protein [Acidobacteriaceae bacterium]|nr:PEP-CTERM sorting domain-containing protein [Acidobacteriaceae bacterium]
MFGSYNIVTVTDGAVASLWYNGTLTSGGALNLADSTFSTCGSGTLSTTPEPGSVVLLLLGLLLAVPKRRQSPA